MPEFLLPDLGEGLEEAEVIAWRVQVGDEVEVDQVVADVETAKAAVELPSPFAGQVAALHAEPGTTVAVGAPLITITTNSHAPGAAEASGNVLIGYGTRPSPRRTRPARRAAQTTPAAPAGEPTVPAGQARTGPVPVISPVVRKLAKDAGLDLTRVAGTGPQGLVRRTDVDQAIAALRTLSPAEPTPPPASARTAGAETRIPLRGARKVAADKLARSRREIPEATVWVDADATGLLAARAELNDRRPTEPVSLLALLARFALAGLRQYPELNARIDGDEVVIPAHVHLGFAAQTNRGLVVPVVKDAHQLSTRELSAALAQRTAAARSGQLAPADLTGGTFTVNNYGVFGVDGSAAIINHPEVAILGMGRIIDRAWVVDGQVVPRKVTALTLAFDHRVCDGGTAGGFLRYVADCVESPLQALGDL
jgi:2-oxoisovalerate dehydrogenase E2 component (dihydrolipoyl transacylase)